MAQSPYRRSGPSSSRMADLVLLAGQQEANAIRESGDRSAMLWANLGNQVARTMADVVQQREQAPLRQMQMENLELETQARKDAAAAAKVKGRADATERAIMPFALTKGDDGVFRYDRDLLTKEFTSANIADRLPELFSGLDKADKAALDLRSAKQNMLAGLGYGVVVSGGSPQSFALAIDQAVKNGAISKEEAMPYLLAVQENPARAMEIATSIASSSPEFAEKLKKPEAKTREIKVRNADGTETTQIVEDKPGQTFTSAAEPPKVGTAEDFLLSKARAAGTPWAAVTPRQKATWLAEYNALNDTPKTGSTDQEWVMRDGKLTPIPKGTARAGDVPYTDAGASKAQDKADASTRALAAMKSYGDDMLRVLDTLIDEDGNLQPGAAGVIGSFDGSRPEWAYLTGGSQNALADIDRLQSMLNIDTLRDMKSQSATGATGFGALSERELNVIESSASKLRRRRQSDSEYAAELVRLRDAIRAGRQDATKPGGDVVISVTAPNGQTFTFPNQKAADEFKKAAGIK